MKILIALGAKEHHKEQLQRNAADAELLFVPAEKVRKEDLADVDAIIGNVPTELLPQRRSCAGCSSIRRGRTLTARRACSRRTSC